MFKLRAGALAIMLVACGGGAPPTKQDVAAVTREAKAPAIAAEPAKAPDPAPVADTSAVEGEDWLVWWYRDGNWRTRWLRVAGESADVVGEKQALIVGDAGRLWQIERADREVVVNSCDCEDGQRCPPSGKVDVLGLQARELDGDRTVTIRAASEKPQQGDSMDFGLQIVGGAQAKLIVESSVSGFFCGAHPSNGVSYEVFDVAGGKPAELAPDWWKQLPEPIRRAAAQSVEKDYNSCNGEDLKTDEIMSRALKFAGAALTLTRGAPTITWTLTASVPYVCSSDYELTGRAMSGLIPEAAPLGLSGPLPAGVTVALAGIGEADSLGFSRLSLAAPEREAKLAAFTGVAERAWPPLASTLREK